MTFGEFITYYYQDNRDQLLKHYPGLSIERLKQEFEAFCGAGSSFKSDVLSRTYVESSQSPVNNFILKIERGVPLEYITNRAFFFRSEFQVTPDVLIPRNETEILVEMAIEEAKKIEPFVNGVFRVTDVGTGSGAIILSIARDLPFQMDGIAIDVSAPALKIAEKNYYNLSYSLPRETMVRFVEDDRLDKLQRTMTFHMIVSNPPYIKNLADRDQVHQQVQEFEPKTALFLDDEQYDEWFETFFKQVKRCLHEKGVFLMEGHENHLENQAQMLKDLGFSKVEIIKDYTDRNRFLKARI